MIQKECFEKEWIDKVCSTHKFRHPELVEKVIRAFSLLEMLVKEGCPLTFKGGTSLLLILGGKARRLSIDIDVLCPPGTDIEKYLQNCEKYGFTDLHPSEFRASFIKPMPYMISISSFLPNIEILLYALILINGHILKLIP